MYKRQDPDRASAVVDVVEMAAADEAAERRLEEAIEGFREQQAGGPDWQPTPSQVQAAVDLARQVQTRWTEISREEAHSSEADESGAGADDESDDPADAEVESYADDDHEGNDETDGASAVGSSTEPVPGEDADTPQETVEPDDDEPRPLSLSLIHI